MFDHVVFGASDYAVGKAFFLKALAPLGVVVVSEGLLGVERCRPNSKASLCIRLSPEQKPSHLQLAFAAGNRQQVHAFHRAALEAGAKDNDSPGLRVIYHPNYYVAFVLVPTGTTLKSSATSPRPNPSLHQNRNGGLGPLPRSGEFKR